MQLKNAKTNPWRTVLTISMGILVIHIFTAQNWLLYISLSVGIVGVFSARLSKIIDYLWMKLAWVLGLVIPNILLGVVFYFVVFPLSLFAKLLHRTDFLSLKNRNASLFSETGKQFNPASFEKPW